LLYIRTDKKEQIKIYFLFIQLTARPQYPSKIPNISEFIFFISFSLLNQGKSEAHLTTTITDIFSHHIQTFEFNNIYRFFSFIESVFLC